MRALAFAAALFLFAAPTQARPFGEKADVHQFMRAYLAAHDAGSDLATVRLRIGFADLNGDRRPDAVVLIQSPNFCGSGGCNLYVLENTGRTYRAVGRETITRAPICVRPVANHGWRDLTVWVGGGGVPNHVVQLRFDGTKYPANPSLQPPLNAAAPAQVMIPADAPSEPL